MAHQIQSQVLEEWPEKNNLYQRLFTLGDIVPLDFKFNTSDIMRQLEQWEDLWQKYNQRDNGIARYGLPYTSIDGDIVDPISLDSIRQYNVANGTHYIENDFCHLTEVGSGIPEFQDFNKIIGDQLFRSHFLRLSRGGYFPPHRDAIYNTSFRIILPLNFRKDVSFFLWEDERILNLENGRMYMMNTVKRHSLFSMFDHMTLAVFNIGLNERIVREMYRHLL